MRYWTDPEFRKRKQEFGRKYHQTARQTDKLYCQIRNVRSQIAQRRKSIDKHWDWAEKHQKDLFRLIAKLEKLIAKRRDKKRAQTVQAVPSDSVRPLGATAGR